MARLQPQAGSALSESAAATVDELVERHRLGELSLVDVARGCVRADVELDALHGSGLNACERGVVEATMGRLSRSDNS